MGSSTPVAAQVSRFYESHPYPPPVDDLDAYRKSWDDRRRRAESHLFWPAEPYRDDRSILVAGCGTTQAAHYALRWPRARVLGIDVSKCASFRWNTRPNWAKPSSTSSAPACCTTFPTRMQVCVRCATSLRLPAPST